MKIYATIKTYKEEALKLIESFEKKGGQLTEEEKEKFIQRQKERTLQNKHLSTVSQFFSNFKNRIWANLDNYKEICLNIIESYEKENKIKIDDNLKEKYINQQEKRVKENKCLTLLTIFLANNTEEHKKHSRENTNVSFIKNINIDNWKDKYKEELKRVSIKKEIPDEWAQYYYNYIKNKILKDDKKILKAGRYFSNLNRVLSDEGRKYWSEMGKKWGKINSKYLTEWRETHINEFKEIQQKGIKACHKALKEHPEYHKQGGKTYSNRYKTDEVFREKVYNKIKDNFRHKDKAWHTQRGIELNQWLKEHPEIREKCNKAFINAIESSRENGTLITKGSKEEISCREELEQYLNIKFEHPIWFTNPDKSTNTIDNKISDHHPFDFGDRNLKLIIEYDGVYWHNNKLQKEADEYWKNIAINKGYIVYRISSEDWKINKDSIKNDLKNIINNLRRN